MPDLVPIRRALLSVSDKKDLIPFARSLAEHGVEIVSTGGTAKALADAGLKVTPIDRLTGFPEIMGGRVKTLHPKVHGGLLGVRDDEEHARAMREHGIEAIDLVCINLYPFEATIAREGIGQSEAIEQIDIGGPSMIRSAAKNFAWVTVVTSPSQYDRVVAEMQQHGGGTTLRLRGDLAATAFGRTSEYDAAITAYLAKTSGKPFPDVLRLGYTKVEELRYGENPHQSASLYRDPAAESATLVGAKQLHGKQLSYNNINDGAAALELVKAFSLLAPGSFGACVIKHTNPCGAAIAGTLREAVDLAIAGDPLAAYGGILAVNRPFDAAAAERLAGPDVFMELIIAPSFEAPALEMLRARWTTVRLLEVGMRTGTAPKQIEYRSVPGGMLAQDRDLTVPAPETWTHAAGPKPTTEQLRAAAFLEVVSRALTSNAVVIGGAAHGGAVRIFGGGAGQVDRLTSCRIAVQKAGELARGAVAAGDAFFPFSDGPRVLIDAGVKFILHPGGSKRDQETFDLCNERGVTCMTTGLRHFRH